mgnify:CR=1 FL=1
MYDAYVEFCEESNLKAISRVKFSKRLISLGYTTKVAKLLGKATRVISKEEV